MEYSGVCKQYLSQLNKFTLTLNGTPEADIINFISILEQSTLITDKCRDAVLPFLCQYAFPPCDVNSSNVSFISQGQCSNIRDTVCSFEWNAISILSPSAVSLLPNCEDFNKDNKTFSTAPTVSQSLQCHYQFKEFCGLCLPLCGKFSQYRARIKFQEKSIFIFGGVSGFIGGILVFISSVYRQKAM